jgi:uncharacterized membrane protein YphA (DoxX/SURF4 family)
MARRVLAVLRIVVGLLLLDLAFKKWSDPAFFQVGGFAREVARHGAPFPFYRPLLQGPIFHHTAAFAILSALGESVLGLSLLLGAFTNPLSIVGLVMFANFALATTYDRPGTAVGNIVFMALVTLFGVYSAGATWGLDAVIARVLPARLVFFPYRARLDRLRSARGASA